MLFYLLIDEINILYQYVNYDKLFTFLISNLYHTKKNILVKTGKNQIGKKKATVFLAAYRV